MLVDQQCIEIFHLVFLKILQSHLDSDLYAIKGGCNLRFFFESIRYSEYIDIDISTISEHTLKKKIDNILNGIPLRNGLAHYQLAIENTSAPKQTSTVQRWKVSIKASHKIRGLPTKIEFSRRNLDSERKAEPIHNFILQNYRLPPMILPHYLYKDATTQKVNALIFRNETQARDVFDLNLLLGKKEVESLKINFDLQKAKECVLSISFNDYRSQVVPYLLPEYIPHYDNMKIWEDMQLSVIENLNTVFSNEVN
ncbi:MAG: nucleotidyl transferase AbiEii/AbiGii toxin family protein [Candidatus Berkiellales bacterium]